MSATVSMQAQAVRAPEAVPAAPAQAVLHPVGVRPVPAPRLPEIKAFRQLVRAAGTIFAGTVTRIEPRPAEGGRALETVAITFHVDHAIRGAVPGESFTVSQWIGTWSAGQRYRVGERVALFLYPASRIGLTSSVAGPMGRFEMDAARRIVLSEQHRVLFRGDPLLGGKSRVTFEELALAVRRSGGREGLVAGGVDGR
ncbi:MAG TPA: hypothetical protein VGG04_19090 [Candidatus Sulfotelmatobacter sp.]